jgi:membrane protease YdiL (CAAX protease family)
VIESSHGVGHAFCRLDKGRVVAGRGGIEPERHVPVEGCLGGEIVRADFRGIQQGGEAEARQPLADLINLGGNEWGKIRHDGMLSRFVGADAGLRFLLEKDTFCFKDGNNGYVTGCLALCQALSSADGMVSCRSHIQNGKLFFLWLISENRGKMSSVHAANGDPTGLVLSWLCAMATAGAMLAIVVKRASRMSRVTQQYGVATEIYRPGDVAVLFILFFLFGGPILAMMGEVAERKPLTSTALWMGMLWQIFLAWMVVVLVSFRSRPVEWLGLQWSGWRALFWLCPLSVACMWGGVGLIQYGGYMNWIESMGVEPMQETVKLIRESKDGVLLFCMGSAALLVAPVCEEIVFRGYCYPVLKKYAGARVSLMITSLVFACAHGNLASALPLFLLGGVLVVVYEKTRSIWAPIGVHFCFNAATVIVQVLARWLDIPSLGEL